MTGKQRLSAWLLIIMSYLFKFGSALTAGYFYLAKDMVKKESFKGGGFFYFFTGIVLITLIISLTKMINKMKANTFKSIFNGLTKIGIVFILMFATSYITYNFDNLTKVLSFTIFGIIIGSLFEIWAVSKYKDYIQEVGIL